MKSLLYILIGISVPFASYSNDSAVFYFKKGIEEKESKRWLMASKHFDKAISFDPKMVNAYLENATVSLEMRKLHQAMEMYKKVHELEPKNVIAISSLMQMNYDYRNYKEAIRLANLCSSCDNADKIIGLSYFKMQDLVSAEKYLQKAIGKKSEDAELYYSLGKNYLQMEEYNKAIPFYEKAVIMDPTKARWMYELGLICYNQGKFKEAVAAFDRAVGAGQTQTNDFKENLGYAAIYSGDYERGESILLELQRQKSGNVEITRSLAEIYYQQKKFDRSLAMCQLLLEKNPNDAKAMYQAGLNFIKKGDKSRGEQLCDKAIEMDGSLKSLRTKKESLGGL